MLQLEIKAKKVKLTKRDVITAINELSPEKRLMIIEGITTMRTVERQKQAFAAAKKLLLDADLGKTDLVILLSECDIMKNKLKKKIKKYRE